MDNLDMQVFTTSIRTIGIQHLELRGDGLTDTAIQHLATYLADPNCTLLYLKIGYHGMTEAGLDTLRAALDVNTSILKHDIQFHVYPPPGTGDSDSDDCWMC